MPIDWSTTSPLSFTPEELKKICRIHPHLQKLRKDPHVDQGSCEFFTTEDHWPIFYRWWGPSSATQVQKVIVCIHGLHAHGEKFILLADHLFDKPWALYAIDLRGHGLSWKELRAVGDIKNYNIWIKDILEFLRFLGQKHPNSPVFIVAESMGAAASIHVAMYRPPNLRSLILLSPAFKAWRPVEFSMILQTLTFGLLGPPTVHAIPVRSKKHFGSFNDRYKEYEIADPFRLAKATPRYNFQVLKMILQMRSWGIENNKTISFYPTCIFYGGADNLVDFEGDQEFIRRIHTKNKALHYIPDAGHELLVILTPSNMESVRKSSNGSNGCEVSRNIFHERACVFLLL